MFRHILVPTDGSASSDIAIQSAMRFAKSIGARVTGLHVIEPYQVVTARADMVADTPEQYEKDSQEQSSKYLLALQQSAREHDVPCDTLVVRHDEVYQAIVQAAYDKQCDLVAMASHGRKGVRDLLLGGETQRVLTRSQIPVLVFR